MSKPRIAVYKFSSCDGCQLSILNLEDELLEIAGAVEIAYFLEATSRIEPGPYDVALVEGSVTTPHEAQRIQEVRQQAHTLIALGTCATSGGIQALRNFANVEELTWEVYSHPEYIHVSSLSQPVAELVQVDLELWGCPVNKRQVIEVLAAVLQNRKPLLPGHSVCLDCKRNGTTCVLVSQGLPCLGPVTRAGCGAICPANHRGCYGCFGPAPQVEVSTLLPVLEAVERRPGEIFQLLRNFSGYAPVFRQAAEKLAARQGEG